VASRTSLREPPFRHTPGNPTDAAEVPWDGSTVQQITFDGGNAMTTTRQDQRRDGSTRRFVLHYIEMVAVMFAGMFVLMAPTGGLLRALGTSWSHLSPAIYAFVMALTMTVPMVAWMRYRGHRWQPNIEMAGSMLIPTFAVMGVLWAGIARGGLMVPEHAGMLTCMLLAMLLRRDEYSCATHRHGHARPAAAA
jgi:hypothetical protein